MAKQSNRFPVTSVTWGIIIAALVGLCAFGMWRRQQHADHELGVILWGYHQRFVTNNLSLIGIGPPPELRTLSRGYFAANADINYAYVEYQYRKFGISWGRMHDLSRRDSGDSTWTPTATRGVKLPGLPWVGSQHIIGLAKAPLGSTDSRWTVLIEP